MYDIIVNPASKSGKGKRIWNELEIILAKEHVDYQVHFSTAPGHVAKLAAQITAVDKEITLIVLGGDGTMNELLQGIRDFSKVTIGYIPTGSSNDLARDLQIKETPSERLYSILKAETILHMDMGKLTYHHISDTKSRLHSDTTSLDRYFVVSTGIGFDAAVCEEALCSTSKNILNKLGLGKLTYGVIALRQLVTAKETSCDLYLDNAKEPIHLKHFLFVASMIHQYEGGGFKFCPNAKMNDGILDLCVIGKIPKLIAFLALPLAFSGKHYLFKGIDGYKAKSLHIKTSAPLWVHTDGEVSVQSDDISVVCLPESIHFII